MFVPNGHMDVLVHRQVVAKTSFFLLTVSILLVFIQERESWSLAHVPQNNIRQPVMLPSKTKCCGNVLSDSQGHHF